MATDNKGYWPYTVRVGDVLKGPTGYRIVRGVSQGKSGYTTNVTFTIQRPSWTGRPYTVLNYVDLQMKGYVPCGCRVKLAEELDLKLAEEIKDHNRRELSWKDVRGMY